MSDEVKVILDSLVGIALKLVIVFLLIIIVNIILKFVTFLTSKRISRNKELADEAKGKRLNSLYTLFRSISRYILYFIVILISLYIFGVNTNGLLGAGSVISLAVGFGAQSLIKDVVTGGFLMFENQFSVGDYVIIDSQEGVVQAIAMRVTYLINNKGNQVIIPNGTISRVINVSRGSSLAIVEIMTRYEDDTEYILSEISNALLKYHNENMISEPEVVGVVGFENNNVKITVTCKTLPTKHLAIERELRLLIKNHLDDKGIKIVHIVREQASSA